MINSNSQRMMLWLTVAILLTAIAIFAASPEVHHIAIKFANLLHVLKHGAA